MHVPRSRLPRVRVGQGRVRVMIRVKVGFALRVRVMQIVADGEAVHIASSFEEVVEEIRVRVRV